jgi:putative intracellular protease/amidase
MKKIAISLLVLALVAAFSATGVVSAATCAATTTTCAATTSAQCTSCTTSTCCCCPCPVVTCCCPVVTCCVVTKCCEVKEVKTVAAAAAKPAAGAVATKGGVAANNGGIAVSQELKQSNEAKVTVDGDNNIVTIRQLNNADQVSLVVPVKINIEDITINPNLAWNGGQIGDNTATDSFNTAVIPIVPETPVA